MIKSKGSPTERWTPKLGQRFCPVSSFFLENYHRLGTHDEVKKEKGLSSTEAMLIIQIMDFKWTADRPFPAVGTLAIRMGLTKRTVRSTLQRLEEKRLIKREYRKNTGRSTTLYCFDGLFQSLEKLLEQDENLKKSTNQEEEKP